MRCRRESKECFFSATRRKRKNEDDPDDHEEVESQVEGMNGVASTENLRDLLGPLFSILDYIRWAAIGAALLLVIAAVAAFAQSRLNRFAPAPLRLPRHAPLIAAVVICAGLALAIAAGARENTSEPLGGNSSRLVTLQSDRYDYWRVAWKAFGTEPLHGVG